MYGNGSPIFVVFEVDYLSNDRRNGVLHACTWHEYFALLQHRCRQPKLEKQTLVRLLTTDDSLDLLPIELAKFQICHVHQSMQAVANGSEPFSFLLLLLYILLLLGTFAFLVEQVDF